MRCFCKHKKLDGFEDEQNYKLNKKDNDYGLKFTNINVSLACPLLIIL